MPHLPPGRTLLAVALVLVAGLSSAATDDGPLDPRAIELMQRLSAGEKLSTAELEELARLGPVDTSRVNLVMLPATVVDRRGRPISGLDAEDFRLTEDRLPQQIRYFSSEGNEPLSIVFLLDLSGSMRQGGKLEAAKQAVRFFVESFSPGDRFALVGFADDQVSWITDFTDDRRRFLSRLDVQRGFGQTALYDAVAATPGLIDPDIDGRRAILLITDGFDNASRINLFDATRLARRVNVPIYTIGFSHMPARILEPGSLPENLRVLRLFADQTGGQVYSVHSPDDMKEAAAEIDRRLRLQYLIGYYPTRSARDGGFRRIRLETSRGRHRVRTRQGYYAVP